MHAWKGIDKRLDMLLQSGLESNSGIQFVSFSKDSVTVQLGYGETSWYYLCCVYDNFYYSCQLINSKVRNLDMHQKVFNTLYGGGESTFRLVDFTDVTKTDDGMQRRIRTVFTNYPDGKIFINPLRDQKITIEWEKSNFVQIFQLDQSTSVILRIVHEKGNDIHYLIFMHTGRKFRHDMTKSGEEERVSSFLWSDNVKLIAFREFYRRQDTYAETTFQTPSGEHLDIVWKVDDPDIMGGD
jgi:hypothetical protein